MQEAACSRVSSWLQVSTLVERLINALYLYLCICVFVFVASVRVYLKPEGHPPLPSMFLGRELCRDAVDFDKDSGVPGWVMQIMSNKFKPPGWVP